MRRLIKKRVVLFDENVDRLNKTKKLFARDSLYQVIETASTTKEAYKKIDLCSPDYVFINENDTRISVKHFKDTIIKIYPVCLFKSTYEILEMKFNRILSDFDSFYNVVLVDLQDNPDINHYNNFILLDPNVNLAEAEISLKDRGVLYKKYLIKVSDLLLKMGVPINSCGYKYLREAIMLGIDSPIGVISITKSIYPNIAQKFSTTVDSVERGIRAGICAAWNYGDFDNISELLGMDITELFDKRPSNSKFLSFVVDRLRLEVSNIVN